GEIRRALLRAVKAALGLPCCCRYIALAYHRALCLGYSSANCERLESSSMLPFSFKPWLCAMRLLSPCFSSCCKSWETCLAASLGRSSKISDNAATSWAVLLFGACCNHFCACCSALLASCACNAKRAVCSLIAGLTLRAAWCS